MEMSGDNRRAFVCRRSRLWFTKGSVSNSTTLPKKAAVSRKSRRSTRETVSAMMTALYTGVNSRGKFDPSRSRTSKKI